MIEQILNRDEKSAISRNILESLIEWFEMGKYDVYDSTNLFYQSCGFKEFEVFPTLWDKENPCQVYVMSLR